MANFFRKLHLWLGLSSGILIFLISISGAMYAFRDEIFYSIHKDKMYHEHDVTGGRLPFHQLWEIAQDALGDEMPISYATVYNNPHRNFQFKAYQYNREAVWYGKWLVYDQIIYVNPYSGVVEATLDHKWEFFHLVKMFHWSFLMNTKHGQPIVSFTVVVFLISLLSGLYLWWPYRKKKKGYRIETKRSKRILNYDLHNVLGFYSIPVNVILSLTGMVWSFKWFMSLVYVLANLSTTPPVQDQSKSIYAGEAFSLSALSLVYHNATQQHPNAYSININPPAADSVSTINTFVKNTAMVYYKAYQEKYDKYTGELLYSRGFDDLSAGEKLIGMNYDIHTGAVAGILGKIIAFIAALIGASLPITGFIVWFQKRKSKRGQQQKLSQLIN